MATFVQNINKIRGDAVYGPEMRKAIADAIQQTMNLDLSDDEGTIIATLTPIQGTEDDYRLTLQNS